MRIADLGGTPLPVVVDTLLRAFEGYFVQMPTDIEVWRDRFRVAGVDWSRSYGAFDRDELVAFIIHGIGDLAGELTAFNTGTGVVPAHRGKQLVDALYAHAFPELKRSGITCCALEVIDRNAVAVRVYERIGFQRVHSWKCFIGELPEPVAPQDGEELRQTDLLHPDLGDEHWHSWSHRTEALLRSAGDQVFYTIGRDGPWGHVVMDVTGRIARMGVRNEHDVDQWRDLLRAIARLHRNVRLVNVHPERAAFMEALLTAGLKNDIDQFEMRMGLS